MHDDFADWYRHCTTGTEAALTEQVLQKRWAGVEKVVEKSTENLLHFVKIIFPTRVVPQEVLSKFRSAFKETDATFQMSGNELELSVLAGAVVCQIMAKESKEADTVALGMICASIVKPEESPWAQPFITFAHTYLDERLGNIRKAESITRPKLAVANLKTQVDAYVARVAENNPGPASEAAKELMNLLIQSLGSIQTMTLKAVSELERQSNLRKEETDILWWMTSGVSRDLCLTFKELKTLAASVVAGRELAELVSPPGVIPAETLFRRILPPVTGKSAKKNIGLIAAVNATDRQWRESVAADLPPDLDVFPTLSAIRQSLSTDGEEWVTAYKKSFGLKSDILFDPAKLSLQMYRECLLLKLVSN